MWPFKKNDSKPVEVTMVSLVKAAAVSLVKNNVPKDQRAAVYLVVDRSGSMSRFYKDGTVQWLAEAVLGLSANLDDDGTVPVVMFSSRMDAAFSVGLNNYAGRVNRTHSRAGIMGSTNYQAAIAFVTDHYRQSGATDPALVVFQTDGAPDNKAAAETALRQAAGLPIFWQFIGFGTDVGPDYQGTGHDPFQFLRKLSEAQGSAVDNVGFFPAGADPRSEFADPVNLYDKITFEWSMWLTDARRKGIIQ